MLAAWGLSRDERPHKAEGGLLASQRFSYAPCAVSRTIGKATTAPGIMDGVDPSSSHGRLQLALFASLAQFERELITERVWAGVMAAEARGVKFGRQAPKQETIETKLRAVRRLLARRYEEERLPARPGPVHYRRAVLAAAGFL